MAKCTTKLYFDLNKIALYLYFSCSFWNIYDSLFHISNTIITWDYTITHKQGVPFEEFSKIGSLIVLR